MDEKLLRELALGEVSARYKSTLAGLHDIKQRAALPGAPGWERAMVSCLEKRKREIEESLRVLGVWREPKYGKYNRMTSE